MDWLAFGETFGAVILGSGLTTAGVNIFFQHRLKKQEKQEEAQNVVKYLALRLAFLFEGYAFQCADKISDHHMAESSTSSEYWFTGNSGPEAGAFIGEVPKLSSFPSELEEGYKLLDQDILNDIFDFPQRCIMANRNAMFWDEIGEKECCTNALGQNTLDMGARALDIGKRLRKKYALESRQLIYDRFDMEKFLTEELVKLKEHKERIRKQEEEIDM